MPLESLQELFCAALSGDDDTATGRFADQCIRPGGTLTTRQRLDIYRRNIMAAHTEALRRVFPVCREILGERSFSRLARDYVRAHPSTSPDLNRYGQHFAGFLADKTRRIAALADYPYLPDLAELEWHWHAAYYQMDDEPFDFIAFASAGDRAHALILHLSHSLATLETPYPVYEIWRMHHSPGQRSQVAALDEPQYLCIYRDGWQPAVRVIERGTFALLQACRDQRSLGSMAADARLAGRLGALSTSYGGIDGFRWKASTPWMSILPILI